MDVLIFVSGYPSPENTYNCTWAHTRSLAYLEVGIKPYVINFGCSERYNYEGIDVFCIHDLPFINNKKIKTLIMHSPNIRNHFRLLNKIGIDNFNDIIIFCHGTESMFLNRDYPKPYFFMKESIFKYILRDVYDIGKFFYFRKFLRKNYNKTHIVFVSQWMLNIFEKNILPLNSSKISFSIINNSINKVFLDSLYSPHMENFANFITIRRFDESKYAIDLLVKHAFSNPNLTYHLYGKGSYFQYNKKPPNLKLFEDFIKPEDIPALLDHYDCAFMPTRCDAQGVMMCEMASYGIPLITSNIDITREMLSTFKNVIFFDDLQFSEEFCLKELVSQFTKNHKFSDENTAQKEINLLRLIGEQNC